MRYLLVLFGILGILVGCGDDGQEGRSGDASRLITLTEAEKEALSQKAENAIDVREKEATKRIARYLELREDEPAAAREELEKAYHLFALGDETFLEEYVTIAERVAGANAVLLPDLLRLNEIQLTLARKNREEAAYISRLVETDEELKEAIAHLISLGKDPSVFKVPTNEDAGDGGHFEQEG